MYLENTFSDNVGSKDSLRKIQCQIQGHRNIAQNIKNYYGTLCPCFDLIRDMTVFTLCCALRILCNMNILYLSFRTFLKLKSKFNRTVCINIKRIIYYYIVPISSLANESRQIHDGKTLEIRQSHDTLTFFTI